MALPVLSVQKMRKLNNDNDAHNNNGRGNKSQVNDCLRITLENVSGKQKRREDDFFGSFEYILFLRLYSLHLFSVCVRPRS